MPTHHRQDVVKRRISVYAVAKGRQPGLYHDWDLCNAQVHGFPCARFKGFSNVEEAYQFRQLHRVGNHAQFVDAARAEEIALQTSRTEPKSPTTLGGDPSSPPPSSFKQHWDEIAASQNLVPGSQAWRVWSRVRTVAGSRKLRELFFDGRLELQGFQTLCRRVGISSPADAIHKCRDDIKTKLVNIHDVIDAVENNTDVSVCPSENWDDFKIYTRKPQNCYNFGIAKRSKILSCFLQDFNSSGPRRTDGHLGLISDNKVEESDSRNISDVDADSDTCLNVSCN